MKRLNRREKWLIGAPLLGLMVPAAVFLRGDGLDRKLRALAGPGAIDCGAVYGSETEKGYEAKGDQMEACADSAYDSGRPFYMREWIHMDGIKATIGTYGRPGKKTYHTTTMMPAGFPIFIRMYRDDSPNGNLFVPHESRKPKHFKGPFQKRRYWLFR